MIFSFSDVLTWVFVRLDGWLAAMITETSVFTRADDNLIVEYRVRVQSTGYKGGGELTALDSTADNTEWKGIPKT